MKAKVDDCTSSSAKPCFDTLVIQSSLQDRPGCENIGGVNGINALVATLPE